MKKSYLFLLRMSAMLLTFGLVLAGCGESGDPTTPPPDTDKFTVTFSGNGNTGGTAPAAITQESADEEITIPGLGTLVKTDEYFHGWNTAPAGDGTNYTEGSTYTPSADITLYAKWNATPPVLYTVTFSVNEGSGTAPAPIPQASEGARITLPAGTGLSKSGFVFTGWNTAVNGSGTDYAAGASFAPTAATTLYAKWVAVYTVTFDKNGGTGTPPEAITYVNGAAAITLPAGTGLTNTGHIFGGWNEAAAGTGTNHAAGSSYTPTADITLHAKWIAVYSISGTVKDTVANNSALLAGAAIEVKNGSNEVLGSAISGSDGTYTISNVLGGSGYTITADLDGKTFTDLTSISVSGDLTGKDFTAQ